MRRLSTETIKSGEEYDEAMNILKEFLDSRGLAKAGDTFILKASEIFLIGYVQGDVTAAKVSLFLSDMVGLPNLKILSLMGGLRDLRHGAFDSEMDTIEEVAKEGLWDGLCDGLKDDYE